MVKSFVLLPLGGICKICASKGFQLLWELRPGWNLKIKFQTM